MTPEKTWCNECRLWHIGPEEGWMCRRDKRAAGWANPQSNPVEDILSFIRSCEEKYDRDWGVTPHSAGEEG